MESMMAGRTGTGDSAGWIVPTMLTLLISANSAAAEDFDLQIHYGSSAPLTAAQQWLAALGPLEFHTLRIDRQNEAPSPRIERVGQRWKVYGVIDRNGDLLLAGRKFAQSEARQIPGWLAGRAQSSDKGPADDGAAAQSLQVWQERLSAPVAESTRGKDAQAVWSNLQQRHQLKFFPAGPSDAIDWSDAGPFPLELKGLSHGTACALLLYLRDRQLLVPQDTQPAMDNRIALGYARGTDDPAAWPVGRASEKPDRVLIPRLLEFAPIEIVQTPLDQVLDALQPRLQVPLLLDLPALEARDIHLSKHPVNFPSRRTFYRQVLDTCLSQVLLKSEVRLDDADRPFLWITTRLPRPETTKP